MKTKLPLLALVLLLSGCATDPFRKSPASQGDKASVTPVMPKATRDLNLNQSQAKTTEGNNTPR
jgi:uncharacterized lipoprotein